MPKESNIILIREILKSAENSIKSAQKLLDQVEAPPQDASGSVEDIKDKAAHLSIMDEGRIIEGVFDGQNMVGPDGRIFPIPANYASKSKLVEGDILKLTISDDGTFVFKQIGPVDRKKIIGTVIKDEAGEYRVQVGDKAYKVLFASVTYFKADAGDEITVIVPRDKESSWAAVENVIKATGGDFGDEGDADVVGGFEPIDLGSKEDQFEDFSLDATEKKERKGKEMKDLDAAIEDEL